MLEKLAKEPLSAHNSGDIFIAFSTANQGAAKPEDGVAKLEMLSNDRLNAVFAGTVLATEEAIINALVAAETMVGIDDHKIDELPQLWNVFVGEMSLVGPRPNLFNQDELIAERDALGVYAVRPGITGLAQVNEIDMSTPKLLAETDAKMIAEMSVGNYFRFILQTVTGKGAGDRVR